MVDFDLHSFEAMADATVSRGIYEGLFPHIRRKWHLSSLVSDSRVSGENIIFPIDYKQKATDSLISVICISTDCPKLQNCPAWQGRGPR
jgi:hypothetical protein